MKKIVFVGFFVFLFCNHLFAQKKWNSFLQNDFYKIGIEHKKDISFYKTINYFLEKNWDSTIVTSSKIFSKNNPAIKDYIHYCRAFSFLSKQLLMKSKKEFLMISPNFKFESKVQMNLGEIALGENKYSTALGYYQSILNDKDFSKNDIKKSALLLNIGLCYFHLNQISVAENFYFKSLAIQQKQKDTSFLISSYINIANLYYEQYKDKEAIYYFKKAYESAANVTDPQLKQMTAFNMAVVEENRGEIVKAMHYRKEFENWNDSLHNQNKVWEIAELEKRFAIQQKQKKINLLSIENRAKNAERNGFFFASLLLLGTLFSGIYFYRLKIHKNKIIENQRNELDQLNATKDKLLSIVSHDLRSSVNALKNSNQKILRNFESNNYDEMGSLLLRNANITNSSYNLLDNILHWAQQQNEQLYFQQEDIHLSKIVDQVIFNYKYILLEKEVTFSNKIPIETLVFCDIDSLKIVFRNLIDNAIKFSKIGGQISMYLLNNQIDDFVCFAIEDTGCGMPQEVLDKLRLNHHLLTQKNNKEIIGTGLGFQLCKSMLKKNNGEITLIESKLNIGTKIIINLPKQKKNE